MSSRPQNPNRAFLIGSAVLAFAVILIVVLFTMLSLRAISKSSEQSVRYTESYRFRFSKAWEGASVALYLNDSILYEGAVPVDSLIEVTRFDEESALLVVDHATEQVNAFELDENGGAWLIEKKGATVAVTPFK